jgi:uncharacterized protein
MHEHFDRLLDRILSACRSVYGDRLVALAVFGSVGRRSARADSDIDLFLVADPLPRGRLSRVDEFAAVETEVEPDLAAARRLGVSTELSPILKTPAEIRLRTPLMFDMVEDARLLYDPSGFLHSELARLRARLAALGARRIWQGDTWYWDLKPDYRAGEVFEI